MPNSKLRWQCRRGMRELDELLVSYLNEYYDESSENEKSAFHELLKLSDPELIKLLLTPYKSEFESINLIIEKILITR
ncbi:MAG: antitoxin CptB [Woeseiaceae bacterium]|mgnify:FL=1|jgi:antitoxin CptB|tara:strand:- start:229 stop:462 length:234 start_codon:yes stop_codon:yes gene_type:complete